jgi:hypothetical protein
VPTQNREDFDKFRWYTGLGVFVGGEKLLHGNFFAGIDGLLKTATLTGGHRGKGLGKGDVLLHVFEMGHADAGEGNWQGERVSEQLFEWSRAEQMLLAGDFHRDHAHVLFRGDGQRQFFEAIRTSRRGLHRLGHAYEAGIEGHLCAIEIVSLQSFLQRGGIGMTGDADGPSYFLVARFVKSLEDAIGFFNGREVLCVFERMNVHDVEAIGLETFQAEFDLASSLIGGAAGDFSCEDDFLAACGHNFADAFFAAAIAIGMGGIDVTNAEVDCTIERLERFIFVHVHQKAAAGAEAENWDGDASAAERPRGEFVGCSGWERWCSN